MIAIILPKNQADYLGNTVIDGLIQLKQDFKVTQEYPCPYDIAKYELDENDFIKYAQKADLILLVWGKNSTNYDLAEKINAWDKTYFIDGSEFGKNRRYTYNELQKLQSIDHVMLKKCAGYFRREKPYIKGIIPLPFGIESRYIAPAQKKDIDFFCIFGQDDYPSLRKEVKKALQDFCKEKGFTCVTEKTGGFTFDDDKKLAGRDSYYKLLARSKVGISIGGGGFDTARFWEILGNDCTLLTETIDIDPTDLSYKRIHQFKNLNEFKILLENIKFEHTDEYKDILLKHDTKARVNKILAQKPIPIRDTSCALVVASCDAFSDVWEPYFTLLFRYWPDCPYSIYLISDSKIYNHPKVKTLTQNTLKKDWSSCVIDSLAQIPEKYIIFNQEDFLINAKVHTEKIKELVQSISDYDAGCIRLFPNPPPDKKFTQELGEIIKGPQYSFSLQATIWDKEIFSSLLQKGEQIRHTETTASLRAKDKVQKPFLSVYKDEKPFPYFSTAIKKGVWYYDAIKLCKKENIVVEIKRPVESFKHYVIRKIRNKIL